MYEMPLRAYDPAIARWNRIDPVVHHGLSPYNAFDNNPVFYADPSGGDSYVPDWLNDVFNNSGDGTTNYSNDGSGSFEETSFIPYSSFSGTNFSDFFEPTRLNGDNNSDSGGTDPKKKKSQKKEVKAMSVGEFYGMAYNGASRTAFLNGNDPYNPTKADIAENERKKAEAAGELAMMLGGEAVFSWIGRGIKAAWGAWVARGTIIARTGKTSKKVVELAMNKLNPLHAVPRAGKPAGYIDNLANLIKKNGFDVNQAIPVLRLPNGKMIIAGGHHRVAAMKQLGEKTIPGRLVEWNSLSKAIQQIHLNKHYGKTLLRYLNDL